ncbi:MAG: tRNA lysidine(34) synthetase TilS [Puniceicoccales bacterium]|jgi:tRNA(Ile)-lysidine synthase|nr:tRNA lysidine(34) synthetase TilS [Puniceicoccales bacterium]
MCDLNSGKRDSIGQKQMEKLTVIDYARRQISRSNDTDAVNNLLSWLEKSDNGEIISIGCSGGSDSVFLIDHILANFYGLKNRLLILHFNHNLRGADSDGDEEFVKALAAKKGLSFHGEKLLDMPENISEESLRSRRSNFFQRAMEKVGSQVLLLGHQKNDVAETLLMRLIRSSNTEGLSAPRAVVIFKNNHVKLRPLLNFTKEGIEDRLRAAQIPWRDDKSNRENDFFRNKIRNIVLPKLQEVSGIFDVVESFAFAKKNIEEANDAVDFFAQKYLAGKNLNGELKIPEVKSLPIAVQKKIFAAFLVANGFDVRKSYVETFLQKMLTDDRTIFSLGRQSFMKFDGDSFSLAKMEGPRDWCIPNVQFGKNILPNGKILEVQVVNISQNLLRNLKNIDASTHCYASFEDQPKILVKGYRPSYRYLRLGHNLERKLGDIITAKILPREERNFLPVVFLGDKICWVPQLPVSNFFRIKEADKLALLLTYS